MPETATATEKTHFAGLIIFRQSREGEEGGYDDVNFWGPIWRIKSGLHEKIFYFTQGIPENFRGQLRQEDILDGEDTLHPPHWIGSSEALSAGGFFYENYLA